MKLIATLIFSLLLTSCVVSPAPRYGYGPGYYRHERYYRWHDHPHWGWHIHYLPAGYLTVAVAGGTYYYYDGLYYSYAGAGDYVLVSPPAGAIVSSIPPDFQPVVINGATYYVNNGTYYLYTSSGYQVVPPPGQ